MDGRRMGVVVVGGGAKDSGGIEPVIVVIPIKESCYALSIVNCIPRFVIHALVCVLEEK